MIIINLSHPLTAVHLQQIVSLTNDKPVRVIEIPSHIDPQQHLVPQVIAIVDRAGLSPEEWQTLPLLINPPSLNFIALVFLAELHGRCGYFPAHLRLRPVKGSSPPQYEVAEILNLQAIRDQSRTKRC